MDPTAYLKGLLAGLDVDKDTKEGKVLYAVCDALDAMVKRDQALEERVTELEDRVTELEDRVAELEELCDILDEDLGEIEEIVLEDEDEEPPYGDCENCPEDCGLEEEQYETQCPTCGKTIMLDEEMLEEGEIICPNCGEELTFDLNDLEALAEDDAEE